MDKLTPGEMYRQECQAIEEEWEQIYKPIWEDVKAQWGLDHMTTQEENRSPRSSMG